MAAAACRVGLAGGRGEKTAFRNVQVRIPMAGFETPRFRKSASGDPRECHVVSKTRFLAVLKRCVSGMPFRMTRGKLQILSKMGQGTVPESCQTADYQSIGSRSIIVKIEI